MSPLPSSEAAYDRMRLGQWSRGRARSAGIARRDLMRLVAAASVAAPLVPAGASPARAAGSLPGVVKPLPPELFTVRGTNAETNFASLRDTGLLTPADRFFVRNHTATPSVDRASWKLTVWGDGLTDGPVDFTYAALRALPSTSRTAFVECAGNGRSFFASQQGQEVSGTAWTLGAVGAARWRGVRLSDVLRRAGIGRHAVDVLPRGLDDEVISDGTNLGRVRRPLPVAKAMDDVLLAYEMNGEPLPPDHGAPVRLIVPSWVGVAHIKWVGDIEVSDEPLLTPWNTGLYRLFGPGHPPEGSAPLSRQTLKSAFELEPGAAFAARRGHRLTGRSWSGGA
ncbi:molybdopterin-dependent oxidoreductase, partial [Streptomyces sp. SID3915]|uniref:molybdopterin-dependent oxidoreductase n=2 Tax=Streptomyces TaxID=1883 RepID=UPI0013702531